MVFYSHGTSPSALYGIATQLSVACWDYQDPIFYKNKIAATTSLVGELLL